MSDFELRKSLIRLAYDRPEFRPHLLPLIRTARNDLQKVFEQAARVVRHPWQALVTRSDRKETPIGTEHVYVITVKAPPEKGVSFSPDVRIPPRLKFYVTEIREGPKAGTYYVQSTIWYIGKEERLHRPVELRNLKEVKSHVEDLLQKNAYERITY